MEIQFGRRGAGHSSEQGAHPDLSGLVVVHGSAYLDGQV